MFKSLQMTNALAYFAVALASKKVFKLASGNHSSLICLSISDKDIFFNLPVTNTLAYFATVQWQKRSYKLV
jgi:hypothetical protein